MAADTRDLRAKHLLLVSVALEPNAAAADIAVMAALLERFNPKEGCSRPSLSRIAADVSRDRRTVQRSLDRLVAAGWLSVISGNVTQANRYSPAFERAKGLDLKPMKHPEPGGADAPRGSGADAPRGGGVDAQEVGARTPPEPIALNPLNTRESTPSGGLDKKKTKTKATKTESAGQTFAEWVEDCRARGEPRFNDYEPIRNWCAHTQLPEEWVHLWTLAFLDKQKAAEAPKRQRDWRKTVMTYLRNEWSPKLWRWDARSNCWALTGAGVAAAREHGYGHLVGDTDKWAGAI